MPDKHYEILGKRVDDMDRDELLRAIKILIGVCQGYADAAEFRVKLRQRQDELGLARSRALAQVGK